MNRKQRRKQDSILKGFKVGSGLFAFTTLHDDWCHFYNGQGECNCNPDYKIISYENNPKQFIKNTVTTAEIYKKQEWWDGNE